MLNIRKKQDCPKQYFSVCLALNGGTDDELCTNTLDGFNNDSSPYITWYKPTENVKTVQLTFRDNQPAKIADLKIFYQPKCFSS